MVTVVTRAANGIPLTHEQVDNNFIVLADGVNNAGSDILDEANAAKNDAQSAAASAQSSELSAANSANAASISRGNAAASAEASAASAESAAASVSSITDFQGEISAPNGTTLIGFGDETLSQYLGKNQTDFGRWSASDLSNFFDALRSYRFDLRPEIPILGLGSSVGAGATLPSQDQAPVNWFVSQLKAKFDPGNLYNFKVYNRCVNGSTLSEFRAVYDAFLLEMAAAGKMAPVIVHLVPGMNDGSPNIFNSGQTYNGFVSAGISLTNIINKNGASCIWNTTPHPATVLHTDALLNMDPGIDQIYPVFKAKPVSPEQMTPPRSASLITADFVGNGVNISMSYRYLVVNTAMRAICLATGAPLIDVERYYMLVYQKYTVSTGSTAGAELTLYGPTETGHPNLLAHQLTYQAGANDFTEAVFRQKGQRGSPVELSGYYDFNRTAISVPQAVMGLRAPYPDRTTTPLLAEVYVGAPDVNGIPGLLTYLKVDPANGDLIHGGGGWRMRTIRTTDGALIISSEMLYQAYGVSGQSKVSGAINISAAYVVTGMPDFSAGEIIIRGQQPGVGTSPQVRKYTWWKESGVLNIQEQSLGTPIGSLVFSVSIVSNQINITPNNANTNIQVKWDSLGS